MDENVMRVLGYMMDTQRIIIQQLDSIVDVLSREYDVSIEDGMLKVGDDDGNDA